MKLAALAQVAASVHEKDDFKPFTVVSIDHMARTETEYEGLQPRQIQKLIFNIKVADRNLSARFKTFSHPDLQKFPLTFEVDLARTHEIRQNL